MALVRTLTIVIILGVMQICMASQSFGQARTTSEEYSIYSEVLKTIFKESLADGDKSTNFVVVSETFNTGYSDRDSRATRGLRNSFRKKNEVTAILEPKFSVKYEILLEKKSVLDALYQKDQDAHSAELTSRKNDKRPRKLWICGAPWRSFYETYPRSNGYYSFSRIGFSLNKIFAVVETEGIGECWWSKQTFLLKKNKKGWRVYKAGGSFTVS